MTYLKAYSNVRTYLFFNNVSFKYQVNMNIANEGNYLSLPTN